MKLFGNGDQKQLQFLAKLTTSENDKNTVFVLCFVKRRCNAAMIYILIGLFLFQGLFVIYIV